MSIDEKPPLGGSHLLNGGFVFVVAPVGIEPTRPESLVSETSASAWFRHEALHWGGVLLEADVGRALRGRGLHLAQALLHEAFLEALDQGWLVAPMDLG